MSAAYLKLGSVQVGAHMIPSAPVMVYGPAHGYMLHRRGSIASPPLVLCQPIGPDVIKSKTKVYAYVRECIAAALRDHEAVVVTPIGTCEDWCMKAACRAACDAALDKKLKHHSITLNIIGSGPDHFDQLVRKMKAVCKYMLTQVKQAGQKKILKAFLVRV